MTQGPSIPWSALLPSVRRRIFRIRSLLPGAMSLASFLSTLLSLWPWHDTDVAPVQVARLQPLGAWTWRPWLPSLADHFLHFSLTHRRCRPRPVFSSDPVQDLECFSHVSCWKSKPGNSSNPEGVTTHVISRARSFDGHSWALGVPSTLFLRNVMIFSKLCVCGHLNFKTCFSKMSRNF